MSDTTFITGDRSNSIVYGPLVAIEIMRALAHGDEIVTGDSESGVDAMVRDFAQRADFEVDVIATVGGDFDERNARAQVLAQRIVLIHTAPDQSRAIASLLQDDDTRLVTHMDLMV